MAIQLSNEQFQTLLGTLKASNNNDGGTADVPSKSSVKAVRPTIDVDTTEGEWAVFDDNWSRFKRMAKLTVIADIRDNLRQCCSAQLNKRLFDVKGAATLNAASEENLLIWIKEIAVRGVHKEVHRTQFVHMRQKQGECLNAYHGRLKSGSSLCDFSVSAPSTCANTDCTCANHGILVSYQDDMVATQLVAGLYNSEHQAKALSESASLVSLEDKLKRLLVLETSDTSLSSLANSEASANYTGGGYSRGPGSGSDKSLDERRRSREGPEDRKKRWRNKDREQGEKPGDKCADCGKQHSQCKTCSGFHKCSTRCNFCKKMGHIKNCCMKLAAATAAAPQVNADGAPQDEMEEEIVFGYCVTVEDKPLPRTVPCNSLSVVNEPLPHCDLLSVFAHQISSHLLSHMECRDGSFKAAKPANAPLIQVTCTILVANHTIHGKELQHKRKRRVVTSGLADTGAQVCTAGPGLLSYFHVDEDFLIPTKLIVKGIAHFPVTILGALFLEVSSNGMHTQQIVYIAREARSLILSETALKDLGVLPQNFPTAGSFKGMSTEATIQDGAMLASNDFASIAVRSLVKNTCGCPVRVDVPQIPTNIPIEKPEANRLSLKRWILNYYRTSAFNICPHQLIPAITGPDMTIVTVEGAEPVAVHSPIPTAHHWKKEVKELLDQNCSLGVIEPVPAGIPTTWCSRMLTTPKKNGTPRIVVDLQPLNAVSKRDTHHTPSPWNLACSIPKGMKKSILDVWNGFHLIPLSLESRDKTTFISEWGRYRYLRAPQGWTGSGDAFTKRFDDITTGMKAVARCIDDSCLWASTVAASFWLVVNYIDVCARNGIIFNPEKFVFGEDVVDFAGYTVTLDSIKPTVKMLKAIQEFPTPTSIKGIRGWFGIIAFVSFAYSLSPVMLPFRELLASKKKFHWDSTLEELFVKTKSYVVDKVVNGVKMFEVIRQTCLATDWSKSGLGFFLLQKHCDCVDLSKAPRCGPGHWQMVFAGSRFLKDPETRYSPVEGEALAVVFALQQSRMFVLGCRNLIVATDHKPLVPILNGKRLDLITNPRLLKFREKTLPYRFTAQHIPGPLNVAADAASRNPSSAEGRDLLVAIASVSSEEEDDFGDDIKDLHFAMVNAITSKDDEVISWKRVKDAAAKDDTCMYLNNAIENGFPDKKDEVEECLRPYYKLKDDLYTIEGVPCINGRTYIPKLLRREVLTTLHAAHQAPAGMKAAARGRFWWLGMNADIEQTRSQCRDCNEGAPSNVREPLTLSPEPEFPWQKAVMDYFEFAALKFLVIADRFTGWPEVFRQNGKAMTLVKTCRNLFAQFGVPEELSFDGGPPFDSYEWKQFLIQWDIDTRLSSANYPQSNGRAELAVKSCRRMLRGNIDGHGNVDTHEMMKALLQYRNTPNATTGMSPAFMLFGRLLRDALPSIPQGTDSRDPTTTSYFERYGKPSNVWDDIKTRREVTYAKKRAVTAERYDVGKRVLPPLSVGDSVSVQNRRGSHPLRWDRTGRVVERLENKQYLIKSDGSGRVLLRTRTHLRKIDPITRNRSRDMDDTPVVAQPPLHIPGSLQDGTKVIDPVDMESSEGISDPADIDDVNDVVPPPTTTPGECAPSSSTPSVEPAPPGRRSTRSRNAPLRLSPKMRGKYHGETS